MAGFAASGGGGGGASVLTGQLVEFPRSVGVPTDYLSADAAQIVLQATYPNLYALTGIIGDLDIGGDWVEKSTGADHFRTAGAGLSNFIALSNAGDLYTCGADPEGTWTKRTDLNSTSFGGATTDGTTWLAVGNSGDRWTTTDVTSTWTLDTTDAYSYDDAHYANGYWVAVAISGVIQTATTADGTYTLNGDIPTTSDHLRCVHYADGFWVVGGDDGVIWTATDPTGTWVKNYDVPNITDNLISLSWNGKLWVSISATGDGIWTAEKPNGTWTVSATAPRVGNGVYCDPRTGSCVLIDDLTSDNAHISGSPDGEWGSIPTLVSETLDLDHIAGSAAGVVIVGQSGTLWVKNLISYNTGTHFLIPATATGNPSTYFCIKAD